MEENHKRQLFHKHRAMKLPLGYENFDQKNDRFLDISDFSWQVEGFDVY
jgi:hypothetical protein